MTQRLDPPASDATATDEDAAVAAAIRAGDQAAFAALGERYRRRLHVHCYRMLGSFDDAEDLVQDTLVRAWRGRDGFAGRARFRTWLYRIATNACLTALERAPRRVLPQDIAPPITASTDASAARSTPAWAPDVPWLQPYPDHLLELAAPGDAEPDALLASRQTIELVFLAALQHLPPRQRAILVSCDVLGWSAQETAEALELTVASVNSALQRAHATMRARRPAVDAHADDPRAGLAPPDAPAAPAPAPRHAAAASAADPCAPPAASATHRAVAASTEPPDDEDASLATADMPGPSAPRRTVGVPGGGEHARLAAPDAPAAPLRRTRVQALTHEERALLAAYMDAWGRADVAALTRLLREDARWAMPPAPLWFDGRAAIVRLLTLFPMDFHGAFRFVPTAANRQPAAAAYLRPHGQSEFRLSGIHVLRIESGTIAEITTFSGPLCARFDLALTL